MQMFLNFYHLDVNYRLTILQAVYYSLFWGEMDNNVKVGENVYFILL